MKTIKCLVVLLATLCITNTYTQMRGDFSLKNNSGRAVWISVLNGRAAPILFERIPNRGSFDASINLNAKTFVSFWKTDPKNLEMRAYIEKPRPDFDPTPTLTYSFATDKNIHIIYGPGEFIEPEKGISNNIEAADIMREDPKEHPQPMKIK